MVISVRLFAVARVHAGCSILELELPDRATVSDLKLALAHAVPSLTPLLPMLRFSVNAEYADDATTIPSRADVAVIPPVSGGIEA